MLKQSKVHDVHQKNKKNIHNDNDTDVIHNICFNVLSVERMVRRFDERYMKLLRDSLRTTKQKFT